ncbi:MAG: ABC transporter ATP-binding protein [Firmicutes bacterium]|nr:ABC transporter ATP-binding protein [Bacillota bacterium]
MLNLERVSFRYPKSEVNVINDLSCEFRPGEWVAVTGRNGCGKTTLVKLITGVLRPTEGRITLDGEDLSGLDLFGIGQRVGCVFQDPSRQLFCRSVREEISYGLRNLGLEEGEIQERVERHLALFGLEEQADSFPGNLSQGEQQRVVLAAVMALGTRYLLLDEPTSSLDMPTRQRLGQSLEKLVESGCGVIVISHERAFIQRWAQRELVLS